jgi:hypothetical protein
LLFESPAESTTLASIEQAHRAIIMPESQQINASSGQCGLKRVWRGDAGLNHCLPGVARRKRRQLRDDCHSLALKRRAAGKIARQRRCEGFRALEGGTCMCYSCRVRHPLAPSVPCRAGDAFREPRPLRGPSWPYPVRPAPALRAQAGFLASDCTSYGTKSKRLVSAFMRAVGQIWESGQRGYR